ncbi:hypothetical protein BJ165DRAFT_1408450 [Panaeolus papilionaceus]|nr:hypothetical protein BJ165DRAFT_1408450 [Panaeolus papilionaceus]
MRLLTLTPLLFLFSPTLLSPLLVSASADSGLYPPGLLPLVNKANILLSTGQFGGATRVYSEEIGNEANSPTPQTNLLAITCSALTHLQHLGQCVPHESLYSHPGRHSWSARASLALYVKAKGKGKEGEELEGDLVELERVTGKTEKERNVGLWNAKWRAECVLGAGDVESAVGDLTILAFTSDKWTQNMTVVPVVEPKTFGHTSFSGERFYNICVAFPTTLPHDTSPAPSPAASYLILLGRSSFQTVFVYEKEIVSASLSRFGINLIWDLGDSTGESRPLIF